MGYKRQGPKHQYWKSLIFLKIPVLTSLRRLLFFKHRNYPITNGKSKNPPMTKCCGPKDTMRYVSQVKMSGIPRDISNINEIDLAYHTKISTLGVSYPQNPTTGCLLFFQKFQYCLL